LETNIKLKQLYKNLNGTSGHTKSTDLIIDIIKRIKIIGETLPLNALSGFHEVILKVFLAVFSSFLMKDYI
jgi:hypothetical protein